MFDRKAFAKQVGWRFGKAALVAVLSLLVVQVFKQKIGQIVVDLEKQKSDTFVLARKAETTRELEKNYAMAESNISTIENAKPMADNVVDVKTALEGIAGKHSIQQVLEFGLPSGDMTTIDCSITLTGNINSFSAYLKDFENLKYLVSIENIGFQTKADGGWQGDSVISMRAKVNTKSTGF